MRFELATTPELRQVLIEAASHATRVANLLMRTLSACDLAELDAFVVANSRRPAKAIEWPRVEQRAKQGGLNLYALGRRAAPQLASGMVATIARNVSSKWNTERWDCGVRETRSPPHYKKGSPIPIRAQDFDLRYDNVSRLTILRASLLAGSRRFELPLVVHDTRQREVLAAIATSWRHGTAAIEQDRLRPWKWYVRISYTRIVEDRTTGIAAAAHRGIRNFLVLVTETGDRWIVEGADIEAFLKQIQARRRSYQRQIKSSSRTGRGRTRALEPIKKLEDKAARWRKTRNQTIARRAAEWLRDHNVKTLYLEDLSGIRDGEPERLIGGKPVQQRIQEWPYYDLGTRLESCLEEYGVQTTTLPAHFISQRCPACGHIAEDNRDYESWKIRCVKCKHVVDLDIGAAQNLLARASGSDPSNTPPAGNGNLPHTDPPATGRARKHGKKGPEFNDKTPKP